MKTSSGTDLVCKYLAEDDDAVLVTEVFQFFYTVNAAGNKTSAALGKWVPIQSLFNAEMYVSKLHILAMVEASPDLEDHYLSIAKHVSEMGGNIESSDSPGDRSSIESVRKRILH